MADGNQKEGRRLFAEYRAELLKRQFSNSEAYDKALLTMSSGLLGLSIAFVKDASVRTDTYLWLLYLSWVLLALTTSTTVINFLLGNIAIEQQIKLASRYYLEGDSSAFKKTTIGRAVDILNALAGFFFACGLVATILFACLEVKTVGGDKTSDTSAPRETAEFAQSIPGMLAHEVTVVQHMQPSSAATAAAVPGPATSAPAQPGTVPQNASAHIGNPKNKQ